MTTTPTSIIVNAVFLAVYALLLPSTIFNVVRHGLRRQSGFVFLLIFCSVRLVANALLIAAYNDNYTSKDVVEGGLILQGFGYAFLFSASLAFYVQCKSGDDSVSTSTGGGMPGILSILRPGRNSTSSSPSATLPQILHLVNTVALILLIVGYIKSQDLFAINLGTAKDATLSPIARAGDILFVLLTVVLAGLVIQCLMQPDQTKKEATRRILLTIIVVLPFMFLRSIFVAYQAFTVNPFQQHVVLRSILQYTSEAIIVIIYTTMGVFLLNRRRSNSQGGLEMGGTHTTKLPSF